MSSDIKIPILLSHIAPSLENSIEPDHLPADQNIHSDNFCHPLITFANSLDLDCAQQNIRRRKIKCKIIQHAELS